ncbi:MAG: TPMT family class I SAM-dependent methyltransferase [Verrucomicrobiota bacterium]|nr:TPMT family class I SAM-dependent methyltransferase [Verrucomicrobiota bacterium]
MSTRSDEPEFWQPRYLTGDTPWDFGGVPLALTQWLRTESPAGRVLIPGCGTGHEVRAFHDAGWDVVAVDYTPAAVARAKTMLGPLGNKVILTDFFTHRFASGFAVIYERTFLCSMPRDRWPAYVDRVAELLADGGRLVGHFLFGDDDDPPPYPLTEEMAQALFGKRFTRVADEPAVDALPMFAERERWQIWQKKPTNPSSLLRHR